MLTFFEHTDLLSTVSLSTLVLEQKGGQAHRNKIGERILNILSGILKSTPMGFSTENNAPYGVSEFTTILMKMSESNIASEEAIRLLKHAKKKMPSPKWFRNMINSLEPDSTDKLCIDMLTRTTRLAKNTCRYKGDVLGNRQTSDTKTRQEQHVTPDKIQTKGRYKQVRVLRNNACDSRTSPGHFGMHAGHARCG